MIFMSYRRDDTNAEVTHLSQELIRRYGDHQVFVAPSSLQPGDRWPDEIRERLSHSSVLLAVVGDGWGDARYTTGPNAGRMRLDDPDDWVRREICTAIRRAESTRVIVVLVDDAVLPETAWHCELDELHRLQHCRIRTDDFDTDVAELCDALDSMVPDLRHHAQRRDAAASSEALAAHIHRYQRMEQRNCASIELPLISPTGRPVTASLDDLRVDLPLILHHRHAVRSQQSETPPDASTTGAQRAILAAHDDHRLSHTDALLVDRRIELEDDIGRGFDLSTELGPGTRLIVVGDPGSGKTTLLQWIAHHYASRFAWHASPGASADADADVLPPHDWLPIMLPCRELSGDLGDDPLSTMLRAHYQRMLFPTRVADDLVAASLDLLYDGRALFLFDGLDEIRDIGRRHGVAQVLSYIGLHFPRAPVIATSRVVGFQAIRAELSTYDHLSVGPLDMRAKRAFVTSWAALMGRDEQASHLVEHICGRRATAKLTDNIFLLALLSQMQLLDARLPARRIDVFRRAVQLMVERRHRHASPPLTVNEVIPHLESVAYAMRRDGRHRLSETEVTAEFSELRRTESGEPSLQRREERALLEACIEPLGLLNIAGTETDDRGYERRLVQFFHQAFQEYFAGRALAHGRDRSGVDDFAGRLRHVLDTVEVRDRTIHSQHSSVPVVEPVFADYWQEAVRLAIAGVRTPLADRAMHQVLPDASTAPREARGRAVFSVQCLADDPAVSDDTVAAVMDAALDNVVSEDAQLPTTLLHEALSALHTSSHRATAQEHLLGTLARTRGDDRSWAAILLAHESGGEAVTPDDADQMLGTAAVALSRARPLDRAHAALALTERCFRSEGKLGALSAEQQHSLTEMLLTRLDDDEVVAFSALWALVWATGAKVRESTEDCVLLTRPAVEQVERALRDDRHDPFIRALGSLLLTRRTGLHLAMQQLDWIYELAVIADGGRPRRALAGVKPTGRQEPLDWLEHLLTTITPTRATSHIAITLGSLGVFTSAMVGPLSSLLDDTQHPVSTRDEAVVYLGMIGTVEAAAPLIAAADTPPEGDDDYRYVRGLLGLLLVDNVDVLATQIHKALPHSDLAAYAYGLAGSRDERGVAMLQRMAEHDDRRIRAAATNSLDATWVR